jgi:hypothetical protein
MKECVCCEGNVTKGAGGTKLFITNKGSSIIKGACGNEDEEEEEECVVTFAVLVVVLAVGWLCD